MARHYLDHASTSPLRPEARAAVVEALDLAGDPGRLHTEALRVRVALEEARADVAAFFGARPREVVFTSSATESIAMVGAAMAGRGRAQAATTIEHSAVRLAAERAGPVVDIGVGPSGHTETIPDLDDVSVVHCQLANHEVGVVLDLSPVIEAAGRSGTLVHVDAAAAAGHIPIDFGSMGVDLMSVSGHKLGGPAGVGVLLVRRGLRIDPLLLGGAQERDRRAGLENLAGAAGLAAAVRSIDIEPEAATQAALSTRLRQGLAELDGVEFNGTEPRVPHIVSVSFADVEPQAVLLGLDRRGIAAHSGSACAAEDLEPSPVLAAMGRDAAHSLRLSVGWSTTEEDVDAVLDALPTVLADLRSLRP